MYECIYCGKNDFRTERGLDQHLVRSAYCQEQREADEAEGGGYYTAEEGMTYTTIVNQAKVKRSHPNNLSSSTKNLGAKAQNNLAIHKFLGQQAPTKALPCPPQGSERANLTVYPNEEYATDYEEYGTALEDNEEEDDDNFFGLNGNNNGEFNEEIVNNEDEIVPEKELIIEFRELF